MIGACSYVPPGSEVPIAIERRGPNGLRILEGRLRLADPAAPECAAARPAAEGFFPPRGALVRALMDLEASAAAEAVSRPLVRSRRTSSRARSLSLMICNVTLRASRANEGGRHL